jgi:hypothetical protein
VREPRTIDQRDREQAGHPADRGNPQPMAPATTFPLTCLFSRSGDIAV